MTDTQRELNLLLRRRGGAFLLDYITTLAILALTQVLAVYVKRHWPLFRATQVMMVPGFLAAAATILYRTFLMNLEVPFITGFISWMGYLVTGAWIFYNWVYLYAQERQSFGKYFIGLRVRRLDGAPVGYLTAIQRHLVGYPLSIISLGLGLAPIIRDPRGRGWHDRLAGTLVENDE